MIFQVLMWISALLTFAATLLYQLHPVFKKNSLRAKMLCSSLFVLTGVFASLAYGIKTDYSVLIISALIFGLLGDFFLDWKKHDTFLLGVLFFCNRPSGLYLHIYKSALAVSETLYPLHSYTLYCYNNCVYGSDHNGQNQI